MAVEGVTEISVIDAKPRRCVYAWSLSATLKTVTPQPLLDALLLVEI